MKVSIPVCKGNVDEKANFGLRVSTERHMATYCIRYD